MLLASLAVLAAGLGCGNESAPVAPAAWTDPSGWVPADPSMAVGKTGDIKPVRWELVKTQLVNPGEETVVKGSRYEVVFPSGCVKAPFTVSISEHDPLLADVEFGPDGTQFEVPVTVTIDYHDTALDPDSELYRGLPPAAFWYDPGAKTWKQIPFEVDKAAKLVKFQVTHFSRYGMSDAVAESEWQWGRSGHGRNVHGN